jgi:hypothetical protein
MDKKFEHEMHQIGLNENLWGGEARLGTLATFYGATVSQPEPEQPIEEAKKVEPVVETPADQPAEVPAEESTEAPAAEPVGEEVDEEDAILEALYEGANLTEELLEYLESTPWDEATEEELDAVLESIADKEVPEELVERATEFLNVIQERLAFKVVGGKKKRVKVKVGGAKQKAHREYMKKMRQGGRRAKKRRLAKKAARKAGAKMKARRTARYHEKHAGMKGTFTNKATAIVKKAAGKLSAVAKKVKEKAGVAPKAGKMESNLMLSLRNLLTEEAHVEPTERDAILVTMGHVAESLAVIFADLDADVASFMEDQYVALAEEYLEGNLHESKVEEADFVKRVGEYAKLVGKCITDLEKKF